MRDKTYLTTSDGETDSYSVWSARTGIKETTIYARLQRGWTIDEALGLRARADCVTAIEFTFNGETLSAGDIAERVGITRQGVLSRHYSGWTIDEIMAGKRDIPVSKGGRPKHIPTTSFGKSGTPPQNASENESIVGSPIRRTSQDLEWNGRFYSRKDLAEMAGISYAWLNVKLRAGKSLKSIMKEAKKQKRQIKYTWSTDDLYSVSNLSYHTGVPEDKIEDLIDRGLSGRDVLELSEEALAKIRISYKGRILSLEEWSEETDIPVVMLFSRLDKGWTDGQVLGYEPSP